MDVIYSSCTYIYIYEAVILAFNVKVDKEIMKLAQDHHVSVFRHNIIYRMVDEVHRLLKPQEAKWIDQVIGEAQVVKLFNISMGGGKKRCVAGCKVKSGQIHRNSTIRVCRQDEVIYTGPVISLKIMKDDVDIAQKSHECGILLQSFDDILVDDTLKAIKRVPVV
jgi:translation initiation factor IF-2